ncbi:hypothetical protein CP965_05525 [Halarcobacter mediterraneus]|uniref:Uncharacterized protein n=1 Tax=Halarcobacter mediterraneus TaxID=2023153 RepID=A0A4Q1AW32_9BACT|nr:hypothetical protein [Halarcobacter mediterraneus]RXK13261.1 hypothetical protein CP965_05525 [Halarcobacter mediterraneus]
MYEFIKAIHIFTVMLFVGTVFFRTFIILKLSTVFTKNELMKVQQALGGQARKIIKINNIFLILSGSLLLIFFVEINSIIFFIKVLLGTILSILFYFVPFIFSKVNDNPKFKKRFHYLYFSLLALVILLSQYIYY